MSETKFTPGPWIFRSEESNMANENPLRSFSAGAINSTEGMEMHLADIWADGLSHPDQATANAHLIAAAPELYEALESIMAGFESGQFVRDISKDSQSNWALEMMRLVQILGKAEAVLAKARGEQ